MFIQIGTCSIYYFLVLTVTCFCFLVYCTSYIISSQENDFDVEAHPLVVYLIQSIFNLMSGIFLLFPRFQNKIVKKREAVQGMYLHKIVNIKMQRTKFNTTFTAIIAIGIISLFEKVGILIPLFLLSSNEYDYAFMNQFIILQLIFSGLLSYPIIHYPLYKHHFISIGILLIGCILTTTTYFNYISHWTIIFYILICYTVWSLGLVLSKWTMQTQQVNSFKFLFISTIFNLSLVIILIPILMYIPCNSDMCSEGVVEPFTSTLKTIFTSGHLVLYVFLSCLFYFVYNLTAISLNEKTTPAHVSLAEMLSNIIAWIYESSVLGIDDYFAAVIVGYILIIIGAVIFHEIIILNFCSLDKYTKNKISERSQDEYLQYQEMQCFDTEGGKEHIEEGDGMVKTIVEA